MFPRWNSQKKNPKHSAAMRLDDSGSFLRGAHKGLRLPAGLSLVGTLAGVLFAAGVGAALQAALLALASGDGVAFRANGLRGADVGFDSDFFGHEGLRVKNGWTADFKPQRADNAPVQVSPVKHGRFRHPRCSVSLDAILYRCLTILLIGSGVVLSNKPYPWPYPI
jgi:uncharacterized protein (DUF58 family)